jgi:hypothetical protein
LRAVEDPRLDGSILEDLFCDLPCVGLQLGVALGEEAGVSVDDLRLRVVHGDVGDLGRGHLDEDGSRLDVDFEAFRVELLEVDAGADLRDDEHEDPVASCPVEPAEVVALVDRRGFDDLDRGQRREVAHLVDDGLAYLRVLFAISDRPEARRGVRNEQCRDHQ